MRYVRRDLRVADRCVQAGRGKLGRIVAVDQIVDDAGVIGCSAQTLLRISAALRCPTSCSLSDISGWRAGVLYPLAGGGRRIRCGAVTAARCLLDLLGPAQRVLAADGAVAGGADSVLVIFRFGATLELGRSERTTMRPLWRYGVDAANTPDRKPR